MSSVNFLPPESVFALVNRGYRCVQIDVPCRDIGKAAQPQLVKGKLPVQQQRQVKQVFASVVSGDEQIGAAVQNRLAGAEQRFTLRTLYIVFDVVGGRAEAVHGVEQYDVAAARLGCGIAVALGRERRIPFSLHAQKRKGSTLAAVSPSA